MNEIKTKQIKKKNKNTFGFQRWDIGISKSSSSFYMPRFSLMLIHPPNPIQDVGNISTVIWKTFISFS